MIINVLSQDFYVFANSKARANHRTRGTYIQIMIVQMGALNSKHRTKRRNRKTTKTSFLIGYVEKRRP